MSREVEADGSVTVEFGQFLNIIRKTKVPNQVPIVNRERVSQVISRGYASPISTFGGALAGGGCGGGTEGIFQGFRQRPGRLYLRL